MTTCTGTATAIHCTITDKRPTPQEAMRILKASFPPYEAPPEWPKGPVVAATTSRSSKDWPERPPERRLDGTLLTDPVTVYGGYVPYPYWPQAYRPIRRRR